MLEELFCGWTLQIAKKIFINFCAQTKSFIVFADLRLQDLC